MTNKKNASFSAKNALKMGRFFILIFFMVSCGLTTTRPKKEMTMAAAAFLAAQESKAANLAPTLFRKSEYYYIKAKSAYRRKYFNKAQQYAKLSRAFAERAEYLALKRQTFQE